MQPRIVVIQQKFITILFGIIRNTNWNIYYGLNQKNIPFYHLSYLKKFNSIYFTQQNLHIKTNSKFQVKIIIVKNVLMC